METQRAIAGRLSRPVLLLSFMVSESIAAEGWKLFDGIPDEDVCYNVPQEQRPHVLHYCQEYSLGTWAIGKYSLPTNLLTCFSNLLAEPPGDVAVRFNYSILPGTTERKYGPAPWSSHREAFLLCTMISGLNDAAEFFKKAHCKPRTANFEKSYNVYNQTVKQ